MVQFFLHASLLLSPAELSAEVFHGAGFARGFLEAFGQQIAVSASRLDSDGIAS